MAQQNEYAVEKADGDSIFELISCWMNIISAATSTNNFIVISFATIVRKFFSISLFVCFPFNLILLTKNGLTLKIR